VHDTETVGSEGPVIRRKQVLLVDDDRDLLGLLEFLVRQAGLEPLAATEPAGAINLLDKHQLSAAVIDLNLRPWDGFELIADIHARAPSLPILVLTARGNEDDKVRALEMGADDYVVKPFGHRELVARIRAHTGLDLRERTLRVDGHALHLTGTEFRVMQYLMQNSNAVVPTAALAKHVWGYDDPAARDVVRVTLHRLRRKLGDDGRRPRVIDTVPGVGLRLRPRVKKESTPPA
jgi:two-component system alkaline phosphatase synthesis response regulator PhoP